MFANSPLGPQIAEARRHDDFVRAAAHRKSADISQDAGTPFSTPATAVARSVRYRVGTIVIAFGQWVSGVELRPLNETPQTAIPVVR